MFNKNFADDLIRTADLWRRKRLLCQLRHKPLPNLMRLFFQSGSFDAKVIFGFWLVPFMGKCDSAVAR